VARAKKYIPVKPDLLFPEEMERTVVDLHNQVQLDFHARWNPRDRVYVFDRLTLTAMSDEMPLTGKTIRAVQVQELFDFVTTEAVDTADGKPYHVSSELGEGDDRLRDIARLYVVHRATGNKGLQGVATTLGVSQSTATRWVAAARKAGLVD
jgi:hypothetical protein